MLSENEMWDLLGRKIQVDLDTGDSRRSDSTVGNLMTCDPVSKSLVIARMGTDNSIETIEWIPSSSVKAIKPLEGSGSDQNVVNSVLEKYFEQSEGSSGDSEEVIKARALKVVEYLRCHHLDVTEKPNGTYIIAGTVRFERPYQKSNLYCDIPLVLKRILKLVEEID